jgi:hypothetical protein
VSSPVESTPRPRPSMRRPDERWSSVTTCRASTCGRRRTSGVTMVPRRRRSVTQATPERMIHGSATLAACSGRRSTWSQRKNPSQPCSSASTAREITRPGSDSSLNGGRNTP